MIELTPQQCLELKTELPRVIDPETKTKYVLVKEDLYERLEALLVPDRMTLAEQRAALLTAGLRAGWDDSAMDIYDREEQEQRR